MRENWTPEGISGVVSRTGRRQPLGEVLKVGVPGDQRFQLRP